MVKIFTLIRFRGKWMPGRRHIYCSGHNRFKKANKRRGSPSSIGSPFFRNPLYASRQFSPTAPHGKLRDSGDEPPKKFLPWIGNMHPKSSMTKWIEIETYLNGSPFHPYQVYGPCILLVVISWVSFWLNREATSDRISLGNIVNFRRYLQDGI